MTVTKPVPYNQGWGKRHLRKTQPFEPGAVCGFLTVIEQLGTGRYTRFQCRCGSEVTRIHADVRVALGKGQVPACNKCRWVAVASKGKTP